MKGSLGDAGGARDHLNRHILVQLRFHERFGAVHVAWRGARLLGQLPSRPFNIDFIMPAMDLTPPRTGADSKAAPPRRSSRQTNDNSR